MKLSVSLPCLLAAAAFAAAASAQNYPAKPVRLVVPFDPGGSTDIIARVASQKFTEYWSQPVLVENRGGASTQIGTAVVAKAAPDGYTLLITPASFSTNPTLFAGKLPYDTERDFSPIVLLNTSPLVLAVNPASPYRTVKDIMDAAKANPGKLNYSSSAVGGSNHLSGELFNTMANTKIEHIPFKGGPASLTSVVAGQVDLTFIGTTAVQALLKAGKLRAVAVSGKTRISLLPDVPTISEAALQGYESTAWNGLAAPAKTPSAIIAKLNADANKAIDSAEMRARLNADSSDAGGGTVEQFRNFLKNETEKWAHVIRVANVKPE